MKKNTINNKKNNFDKIINNETDICTIIEKCSIEEISKYLTRKGKRKVTQIFNKE